VGVAQQRERGLVVVVGAEGVQAGRVRIPYVHILIECRRSKFQLRWMEVQPANMVGITCFMYEKELNRTARCYMFVPRDPILRIDK
jgi:hypothetical protein